MKRLGVDAFEQFGCFAIYLDVIWTRAITYFLWKHGWLYITTLFMQWDKFSYIGFCTRISSRTFVRVVLHINTFFLYLLSLYCRFVVGFYFTYISIELVAGQTFYMPFCPFYQFLSILSVFILSNDCICLGVPWGCHALHLEELIIASFLLRSVLINDIPNKNTCKT